MKQILLLTATVLIVSTSCFAKIWRVNNNPGVSANFTSLQAAHNGASSGDTLYLESSPYSYGAVNCTKTIAIIGTGYFLDQNLNLQASSMPSRADAITFSAGSAGSIVEGVAFNGSSVNIYVNDVVVRRNHFGSYNGANAEWSTGNVNIYSSASNIFITQNFALKISNNSASSGILIANNYICEGSAYGENTLNQSLGLNANTVAIVKNNLFRRGAVVVYNSNFSNNIMYLGSFGGSGNLVANNIGNGTQFGTADGNQENVAMSTVFVGTGSYDGYYKLKVGSPAIGAGYGSTVQNPVDAGMFGGTTSYVLSGLPAIPSIYFFANQPVGSNSDPIDVQVKVRSNN